MSPIRCTACGKNVSLEIGEIEVEETRFDDADIRVEADLHMMLVCAECRANLGEYSGTSVKSVPKLGKYLENHGLDAGDVEVNEAEVTATKIIPRGVRKTYAVEWAAQLKLSGNVFKVAGELAIDQDLVVLTK